MKSAIIAVLSLVPMVAAAQPSPDLPRGELKEGYRGFALPLDSAQLAVIKPGDRVDVISVFDRPGRRGRTELGAQRIESEMVLSTAAPLPGSNEGSVELAVNPSEAGDLALFLRMGSVRLAYHPGRDDAGSWNVDELASLFSNLRGCRSLEFEKTKSGDPAAVDTTPPFEGDRSFDRGLVVPAARSELAFLKPGDFVDLDVFLPDFTAKRADAGTVAPLLQGVRVLAIASPAAPGAPGGVEVELSPESVLPVAAAIREGQVSILRRGAGDAKTLSSMDCASSEKIFRDLR